MKILQKIVFLQKSSGKFKKKRFDIEKYTFFFDKIGVTRLGLGTAKKYYEREKMKKLLSVSIMAMLAVSPMMANADPVSNTHGPTHSETANSAASGVVAPFASESITTDDQAGIASAAYVKGAYNAAIRAVNTVAADVASVSTNLDGTITNKINAAGGAGIAAANGKVSIDLATSNSGLAFDGEGDAGKLKVAITTNNVASGSLATGTANNDKLATQGYVADTAASAASTALTDYKVKDVAANGDIEVDANGNIDLSTAAHNLLTGAVQDVSEGTTAGTIKVDGTDVAVHGLAAVATSGNYSDLTVADGAIAQSKINGLSTALSGASTAAVTTIEGKLDDGANGYDIDAKTLKIQGTSVATKADVASTVSAATVTTSGTINLYNAWGATTTTPVTVQTTGGVDDITYTEPQG